MTGPRGSSSRAASAFLLPPCWEVGSVGSRKRVWAGGTLSCVLLLMPHSTGGQGPEKVAGDRRASTWGT